jgi:hypothetical protein
MKQVMELQDKRRTPQVTSQQEIREIVGSGEKADRKTAAL